MKKAAFTTTTLLAGLSTGIAIGASSTIITASASDPARTIAESWYEQLVTEGKNEATFKFDEFIKVEFDDIFRELLMIDSPDTLFDGAALPLRGGTELSLDNGEYSIRIKNGYDVAEADRLTTTWAKEVEEKAGKEATDREKIYVMSDLITSIFSYALEGDENEIYNNFVSEYNDDRKIRCEQFSTIAYLVANKLGIDCEIMCSSTHAYNIVRLDNDDEYTILDLTRDRYGLIDYRTKTQDPGIYDETDAPNELNAVAIEVTNKDKKANLAGENESLKQFFYYLTHGYSMDKTEWEIAIIGNITEALRILLIMIIVIAGWTIAMEITKKRNRRRTLK